MANTAHILSRTMQAALISSSRPCNLHRELHASISAQGAQKPNKRRCVATSCQATAVEFSKYQGLGNDFILVRRPSADGVAGFCVLVDNGCVDCCQVDNRHQQELLLSSEAAAKLCDRNFGIGGDGVGGTARCSNNNPVCSAFKQCR